MKRIIFLLVAIAFGLCCKAEGKELRSLVFIPDIYQYGIEAQEFTNASFISYRTADGYKTFAQNEVKPDSDTYNATLRLHCNPYDANLSKINFHFYVTVVTYNTRASNNIDYSNLFNVDTHGIRNQQGVLFIPVSISKDNMSLLKYNHKHQLLNSCVYGDSINDKGEKDTVTSDYFILQFKAAESAPLSVTFKGISWWDLEGDYSINLDDHVFQVSEESLDKVMDSIQITGNRGYDVNIHKVDTDEEGITRCCVAVEKSSSEIYAYKYIKVKFTNETTEIAPIKKQASQTTDYYYNLAGQRIQKPRLGVYIYKRKKYILK